MNKKNEKKRLYIWKKIIFFRLVIIFVDLFFLYLYFILR